MAIARVYRKTMRDHVRDTLRDEVTSGRLDVGAKLPRITALATRFGTSFRTVQMALCELEREGYVVLRHGAGSFVADTRAGLTLEHSVVLCMGTQDHVFGEMARKLTVALQQRDRIPTAVEINDPGAMDIVERMARAGSPVFIFQGGLHTNIGYPRKPVFKDKLLIGILDWFDETQDPDVAKVLIDHRLGGEKVAAFLSAAGHRHILLAGPESMIGRANRHSAGFLKAWAKYGGTCTPVAIHYDPDNQASMDVAAARALFDAPDAPTGVFGLRDFDVCSLCKLMGGAGIGVPSRCELVGYGNTPWSSGGTTGGFSSVDWSLDDVVSDVCELIKDAETDVDRVRGVCRWVPPRFIARSKRI